MRCKTYTKEGEQEDTRGVALADSRGTAGGRKDSPLQMALEKKLRMRTEDAILFEVPVRNARHSEPLSEARRTEGVG